MLILGLTGSIGMGKSTTAAMLRGMGLPVHDSDAVVHRLMASGGAAVPAIATAFPEAMRDGVVDRRVLGGIVFADQHRLVELEGILHPLVRADSRAFLKGVARRRGRVAVLDIPLLYEAGRRGSVDHVMVVSAPYLVQRQRVLSRPGMTAERLAAILKRQMPDAEKRLRAEAVVPTGLGHAVALRALQSRVRRLRRRPGSSGPPDTVRERRHARNRPRY